MLLRLQPPPTFFRIAFTTVAMAVVLSWMARGQAIKKVPSATPPISSTASAFVDEVPSGAMDGVNRAFVLSSTPMAGSLQIYRNGVLQRAGLDYSQVATSVVFIRSVLADDLIFASYRVGVAQVIANATLPAGVARQDQSNSFTAANTFTSSNDFSSGTMVISRGAGVPTTGCASASDVGRVYSRSNAATPYSTGYICANTSAGTYGWELFQTAPSSGGSTATADANWFQVIGGYAFGVGINFAAAGEQRCFAFMLPYSASVSRVGMYADVPTGKHMVVGIGDANCNPIVQSATSSTSPQNPIGFTFTRTALAAGVTYTLIIAADDTAVRYWGLDQNSAIPVYVGYANFVPIANYKCSASATGTGTATLTLVSCGAKTAILSVVNAVVGY